MGSAENLAVPNEQPDDEAEIVALRVNQPRTPQEMEMEDLFFSKMLSDQNREFILKLAEIHGEHPYQILDAAVGSYKFFVDVIDGGSALFAVDKYGQSHPIFHSDNEQPPAA